ncbi:hypothetical protein AJ87_04040 [Rhizobium yanglingense]|nr:hypothetical protein AJ87_04040 [Rhizobium yanglingense]
MTEQQLKDRNPQTLLDTLAYTPGTRVGAYGFDPRFDSFTVRGFDVTYTGVFRDNLRQPGAGSSLFKTEPYGLEGVSILRGPSSALYGASGAGGLYNLITKRPTEDPYHELQLQYGTQQRYQSQFDFSGPVNDRDPFYYRLTGLIVTPIPSRSAFRTTASISRRLSHGSRTRTQSLPSSANIRARRRVARPLITTTRSPAK